MDAFCDILDCAFGGFSLHFLFGCKEGEAPYRNVDLLKVGVPY